MRKKLAQAQKIVIKMGSSQLIGESGFLNVAVIGRLAETLSSLMRSGKEVVFVTSGAVAIGARKMGYENKPKEAREKQACAAVGQVALMSVYAELFSLCGIQVGQILLTKDVLENEKRKQNVINTFIELLGQKILPIVNENDSVSIEEIENIPRFGDNDNLASVVASLIDADVLILLSDIDGYYDKNPREFKEARLLKEIKQITPEIIKNAQGAGSSVGTGGMYTKIEAAKFAIKNGCEMVIANGEDPRVILEILEGKEVGSWFVAGLRDE